jgi:hypothetical protein
LVDVCFGVDYFVVDCETFFLLLWSLFDSNLFLKSVSLILAQKVVLPVELVKSLPRSKNWGKITFRNVPDFENYKERWDLITEFLEGVHRE